MVSEANAQIHARVCGMQQAKVILPVSWLAVVNVHLAKNQKFKLERACQNASHVLMAVFHWRRAKLRVLSVTKAEFLSIQVLRVACGLVPMAAVSMV